MPKTVRSGTDQLILDREDSVLVTEKARGRAITRDSMGGVFQSILGKHDWARWISSSVAARETSPKTKRMIHR